MSGTAKRDALAIEPIKALPTTTAPTAATRRSRGTRASLDPRADAKRARTISRSRSAGRRPGRRGQLANNLRLKILRIVISLSLRCLRLRKRLR